MILEDGDLKKAQIPIYTNSHSIKRTCDPQISDVQTCDLYFKNTTLHRMANLCTHKGPIAFIALQAPIFDI